MEVSSRLEGQDPPVVGLHKSVRLLNLLLLRLAQVQLGQHWQFLLKLNILGCILVEASLRDSVARCISHLEVSMQLLLLSAPRPRSPSILLIVKVVEVRSIQCDCPR